MIVSPSSKYSCDGAVIVDIEASTISNAILTRISLTSSLGFSTTPDIFTNRPANIIAGSTYVWNQNICSGVYLLQFNTNGCIKTQVIEVLSNCCEIDLVLTPTHCTTNTSNDGAIAIKINGGTSPYTVRFIRPDGSSSYGNLAYNRLSIGSYVVIVTDVYGCSISETVSIVTFEQIVKQEAAKEGGGWTINNNMCQPHISSCGDNNTNNIGCCCTDSHECPDTECNIPPFQIDPSGCSIPNFQIDPSGCNIPNFGIFDVETLCNIPDIIIEDLADVCNIPNFTCEEIITTCSIPDFECEELTDACNIPNCTIENVTCNLPVCEICRVSPVILDFIVKDNIGDFPVVYQGNQIAYYSAFTIPVVPSCVGDCNEQQYPVSSRDVVNLEEYIIEYVNSIAAFLTDLGATINMIDENTSHIILNLDPLLIGNINCEQPIGMCSIFSIRNPSETPPADVDISGPFTITGTLSCCNAEVPIQTRYICKGIGEGPNMCNDLCITGTFCDPINACCSNITESQIEEDFPDVFECTI